MSLLQNYQIKPSTYQVQPFEHYKGKPNAHGYVIDPNRLLILNYLRPNPFLPESDIEQTLNAMIQGERTFVALNALTGVPVSLSIDKSPRSPVNWTATYLFPVGEVEDYLGSQFESETAPFVKDTAGILSWSMRAEVSYEPYVRPVNGRQRIEGYVYSDLLATIEVNTDFEISNPTAPESVITEGLVLNINPHTLKCTVEKSEDTDFLQVWHYSWEFGVL